MTAAAPFVGREDHLASLERAFRETKEGRPVTVFVNGSSGLGKTALVRHFLKELRQHEEVVILTGRCYERESVPYKAFDSVIDALSRYLKRQPPSVAEALMPRDILALARLFPVLQQVDAIVRARRRVLDIPDSQELRRRAFAALRELLARLSDHSPLVIFLDDLQWGDVDSAVLLNELLRPPDSPTMLLIACYRSEEALTSSLLRTLLPLHSTAGSAVDIRDIVLGEFTPREARELALVLLSEQGSALESHAATIIDESGGNPFFINELVQYFLSSAGFNPNELQGMQQIIEMEAGEISLDKVIRLRVRQLPEEARRLLEVVAVAAQPLDLQVAKQVAEITSVEHETLAILRVARLVRTQNTKGRDELETYHDRIRETLVADLSPATTQAYHYHLGVALEGFGRYDPEILAMHFQAAGEDQRAAHYASAAAAQASQTLAFDRAVRLYQLALNLGSMEEPEARVLRIKLGDALANAGRGSEAAAVYSLVADGASPAEALELNRRAAEQLLRSGHVDKGLEAVRTVLDAVGMKLPKTPRRALVSVLILRALVRIRGLNFRKRDTDQVSAEDQSRIDICWSVAIGLARVDYIRAAYFQSRHLLFALRAGEPYRLVRALAAEVGFSAISGRSGERRTARFLRAVEACAHLVDHPHALGLATFAPAFAAFYQGRFKTAFEISEQAQAIFRERCTGVAWEINTAQNYMLSSLLYLGEIAEMSRRVPMLLREAKERGDLYTATDVAAGRHNIVWLAADDVEGARMVLHEAIGQWSMRDFHYQHWLELFAENQADIYDGKGESAWNRIGERWSDLIASLALRIQLIRIEALQLRGRSALAAAASGLARKELLPAIQRDADVIEREKMPWATPLAQLMRAGIAAIRSDSDASLPLLLRAAEGFDKADMALYAAVARRRRGELLGGDEGRDLITTANNFMVNQRIKNPTRMTALLAPGFRDF